MSPIAEIKFTKFQSCFRRTRLRGGAIRPCAPPYAVYFSPWNHLFYTLDYFLDAARETGVQNVNLWAANPHVHLDDATDAEFLSIGEKLRARELNCFCVCPEQVVYPFNIAAEDALIRRRSIASMKRAIDLCAILNALPYFAGERTPVNDPRAKGMLFGMTLRHTRRHMYRSALEAVGYSLAEHFAVFRENDVEIRTIYAVGGGTKAPLWMQMIADILGREIATSEVTIDAAFGDAVMAAIGTGHFDSFAAIRKYIDSGRRYVPDMRNHEKYRPYAELFHALYERNKDLMKLL